MACETTSGRWYTQSARQSSKTWSASTTHSGSSRHCATGGPCTMWSRTWSTPIGRPGSVSRPTWFGCVSTSTGRTPGASNAPAAHRLSRPWSDCGRWRHGRRPRPLRSTPDSSRKSSTVRTSAGPWASPAPTRRRPSPGRLRHLACTTASFGGAKELVARIRLTATDAELSVGDGPEVRGTALALLLVASGRRVALDELDGPGVDLLSATVGRP